MNIPSSRSQSHMCCFACRDQPIRYVGAKASRHVCPRTVRNVPRRFSDHAGGPLCAPGCVDVKQMGPVWVPVGFCRICRVRPARPRLLPPAAHGRFQTGCHPSSYRRMEMSYKLNSVEQAWKSNNNCNKYTGEGGCQDKLLGFLRG